MLALPLSSGSLRQFAQRLHADDAQRADPSLRMLIAFGATGAIERAVVHQGTLQPAGRMHLPFTPSTTSDLGLL